MAWIEGIEGEPDLLIASVAGLDPASIG